MNNLFNRVKELFHISIFFLIFEVLNCANHEGLIEKSSGIDNICDKKFEWIIFQYICVDTTMSELDSSVRILFKIYMIFM